MPYKTVIHILVSLLIIILAISSYKSQYTENINALKTKIINETNSTKLADLYYDLAKIQVENDNEEALINANQSLSISKSVHYTKGSIKASLLIGEIQTLIAQYDEAQKNILAANDLSKQYANYKDLIVGYLLLAKIKWITQLNEEAEEYLNSAENLSTKLRNMGLMSMVNNYYGDYNEYISKKNLALQYYLIAYEYSASSYDDFSIAQSAHKLGKTYQDNDIKSSLEYYTIALKNYEAINDIKNLTIVNFEIGNIHQYLNKPKEAVIYFKTSIEYAQKCGFDYYIKLAYQNIAETYEKNNNYKEAYEYLKFYAAIKDTREITELEAQLELEKTNKNLELILKENELNLQQIEKEKIYRNIITIVILVILALALFLFLSLKQREKINNQLKKATQETNRSKKEKEDFFAYTSHEIRTPLNAVVGLSKLLGNTELNELQQKYVKTIASSAQNILFLVNDVLDLTKIEKGEIRFERIPFNLKNLCEQIIQSLSFKKFEKNIELKLQFEKNVPEYIYGDPIRMNQILLNLTDNAIKFTKKGSVTIIVALEHTLTAENIQIKFSVADTGIGIEPDKINEIFDSYKQAHLSTARQFGGTGLGLSISKLLVSNMGGELNVISTLNYGSIFFFSLTFDIASPQCLIEDNNSETNLSNCSILLVDDNQLNREVIFDLLNNKQNNVNVTLTTNGKEALQELEKNTFDIILMDIQMPILDGYETTKLIRKNPNSTIKNIPIIAMTAHVLDGVHQNCLNVGMNDTIAKPINTQILYIKINDLIKQSKKQITSNYNQLAELTQNNELKLIKYLSLFQKNLPKDLELLKNATTSQNTNEIMAIAHKIKGSLVYLNNETALNSIEKLENLKLLNLCENEINTLFQNIEREFIIILKEIENTLTKLSTSNNIINQ